MVDEVISIGMTQAEAVGILLLPGTTTGHTRAADGIFAGRAAIVSLAEDIAIGRRPVAVRVGVLIVRIHLDVHILLVGAPGLPAPPHAVQFLRKVAAGKRVQRERSVNPEVLGEEDVAVDEVRGGFRWWRRDQLEGAASLVVEFARGAEEAPAQVSLRDVRRVLEPLFVPCEFAKWEYAPASSASAAQSRGRPRSVCPGTG